MAGLETGVCMMESAHDPGETIGIGAACGPFQKLPGLAAEERLVGCQRLPRERAQKAGGQRMSAAGNRFGFEPDKNIFVTIEDRLQLGQPFDQAAGFQVFLNSPETDFELPFTNEILVPLIGIFGAGTLGRRIGHGFRRRGRRSQRRPRVGRGVETRIASRVAAVGGGDASEPDDDQGPCE